MTPDRPLRPHPDRLFPADPSTRSVARRLYASVRELPVISPHSHVPAEMLLADRPFTDPTALLITPDHYVTRLLHADGVPLEDLGVGVGPLSPDRSRAAWRLLCERWPVFRGTPVRYWLQTQLHDLFGVETRPAIDTADAIFDAVSDRLREPGFRPLSLLARCGLSVLATTDDPLDDLAAHRGLAARPDVRARIVPTFRPDRYLEPGVSGWNDLVDALGESTHQDVEGYQGFLRALEARRRWFIAHGAVSADHGHADVVTLVLEPYEAESIFASARQGRATPQEATALRRHLLGEMARMSVEDGLVMTLHPGVHRDHHLPTARAHGRDVGADIPVRTEFTRGLKSLLDRFGTADGFHLVLFTVDESTFSREIAPLAGFYPAVYAGAPWWFLDAPEAIRRFRGTVTETIGFSRTSGFIDDTRALCSIAARHDMARRLDAAYLAELVVQHRLDEDEAFETARSLVDDQPRRVFKL